MKKSASVQLKKSPTGIKGLDELTNGGLPKGRPTLVCGGPGCGKTMLGVEFLVRGALNFDEPGLLMAFEEIPEELAQNVASLGFDLKDLCARKRLSLDYVHIERSEIQEAGEYDLEGLFVRLQHGIESVGANRVVLDTLEALFSGFSNVAILRAEIRRLFRWLKEKHVTTIVTAERGDGALTRYGLEEYISDCVILLDHRIADQLSTRRLRVVKYRGASHGADEYPFLIDENGISVLPLSSLGLGHRASTERAPTGVPDLDDMLEGKGYYRGSTVLVSGCAGSGKTSIAAHFVDSACRRGEECLFLAFEESPNQVMRNMRSIGIDLQRWIKKGLLQFDASRPTQRGLEMQLVRIHKLVTQCKPRTVVIDPITTFISSGNQREVRSMLVRLIDFLKEKQITALFTNLTSGGGENQEESRAGISSLIDTWLLLQEIEANGERNRELYVAKSRGMAHSNQIREFLLTDRGVKLVPVYLGAGGVLTGSARLTQEAQEKAQALAGRRETERKRLELERKRKDMQARISALRTGIEAEREQAERIIQQEKESEGRLLEDFSNIARSRKTASPDANSVRTKTRGGRL
ncbi:MAG: circadian clock protein KaiC [Terriglobia bacterium]